MMDLPRLLRFRANRETIDAVDQSLMREAADVIEVYQKDKEEQKKVDVSLAQRLKEDRDKAYDGMCRIGAGSEIWQDELIYYLCKGQYDIIEKLERSEKKNVSERN